MRRFAYSGIRWEDYEGTLWSSPLDKYSVAASRLISVGFCALLEWLTWWIIPSWRDFSTLEGIGVYNMASVTRIDSGSSVMPMGVFWGSDPGCRSWGPGSRKYFCQSSLGMGIIEYFLRCYSFVRVDLLLSNFWVLLYQGFPTFWDCALPHVLHSGEYLIKEHMVLGGNIPSSDV